MSGSWQKEVYGTKTRIPYHTKWSGIRRIIVRRDHQECQRCERKLEYEECTVHHIKPRDEGGEDYIAENLITLCPDCHDWVEMQIPPLRSRAAIVGSFPSIPIVEVEEGDFVPPDWHRWVYGGYKPPQGR